MVSFNGTLTAADGSTLDVTADYNPPPTTPPPAPTGGVPASVEVNGVRLVITTPGRLLVNAYRDQNDLVIYTGTSVSPANQWGKEVAVGADGKVVATGTGPLSIPAGGFVLSGHYETGQTLSAAAPVGATVVVKDAAGNVLSSFTNSPAPAPTPTPTPTPTPGAFPTRQISVYKMMFDVNNQRIAQMPGGVNAILLAFANQSSGALRLCGYSMEGKTTLVQELKQRQAAGVKIVLSIGGAGYPVNTSDVAKFVADFKAIGADLGITLDGIDWDLEHTNNTGQIVAISKALRDFYGVNFAVCYTVGGVGDQAAIDNRVGTGVALEQAGVLTSFAWQLYDTEVSLPVAKWRLQYLIDAGIPKAKTAVGMMLGSDAKHWDSNECRTYMQDIYSTMGLTRASLWPEVHNAWTSADSQWVNDMKAIIG